MLEKSVSVWHTDADVICIPTSDFFKNGELEMKKGLALEAKQTDDKIPYHFAKHISNHGNTPCMFMRDAHPHICSLPVKFYLDDKPSLGLIVQSVKLMLVLVNWRGLTASKIALPRPGCDYGEFDWESEVKPLIEPLLDDRFVVCEPKYRKPHLLKCIKQEHCPVNLHHCCDVCRLRDTCPYVCAATNCEVRKTVEKKVLDTFYRNQDTMRKKGET